MKIVKETKNLSAVGPYSLARQVGDLIFLSGQIGINKEFKLVEGGVEAEFRLIMKNVEEVLKEYNLDLSNVINIKNYLTKLEDFGKINELYKEYFNDPFPTRTTFQVAGIPLGASIEIELIAS